MRAARVTAFGPPGIIAIEEVAVPVPGPGQVLVEVKAAAVTPLDTYLRAGVKVGDYTPVPPYTPGAALSGIVAAVGPGVTRHRTGQRVYGRALNGSNADYALAGENQLHPLPDKIAFADGAVIAVPYETAFYSLNDLGRAAAGDIALVHGAAGSVGAAAVQIARALGLTVIASAASVDRDAVLANGAHHHLDYLHADFEPEVARLTANHGVDVIVEIAAKTNLALDLAIAAVGARIAIVGGTGPTEIDALPIIAKGLRIAGVDLRSIAADRLLSINEAIVAGMIAGTLRPYAAQQMPLDQAAAAHAAIEAKRASGGLVLVTGA